MNNDPNQPDPPKAPARRQERDFQPHLAGEYMLNAVLRDYLRNNLPPDFKSRILGRLSARLEGKPEPEHTSQLPPDFSHDNLDEALGAALADIHFGPKVPADGTGDTNAKKAGKSKPYQVADIIHVEPRLWHYRTFRHALASVAVAASLVGGWFYFNARQIDDSASNFAAIPSATPTSPAATATDAKPSPPSAPNLDAPNLDARSPSSIAAQKANSDVDSEELLAAPSNAPDRNDESLRNSSLLAAEAVFSKAQLLPSDDLNAIVNSQIAMAWEKAGFPKSKQIDDATWLSRITQIAIGRIPTTAEQEAFRSDKSNQRFANAAETLVASNEFAMHWSRLLAEHYLERTISSVRSQPSNIQQFTAWIKDGLQANTPIGSLEADIGFPVADATDQTPKLWFTETLNRELLTAKDRELNSKLSFKYDAVDAPIVNLTGNMLHRSGFRSASCVQCHAPNSETLAFVESDSGITQKQFWSMSAYVMEQAAKSGTHLSNQTNQFFFEEDNGRITVASPKLSIDYQGTARTVDLKDWFAHNASARNGVVELVWKNVFFQPLVPEFGLSSDEALEERSDLKKLLSGQLQSSGSLQKLVSTMLLADALKRTDAAVSAGWYLRAQDNVLSAYHQRTRLFAFVPSPARDLRTIRASRNNELTAWIRGAQLVENHAQLAQPSSNATAGSAPNAIQSPFLQESAPKLPELDPSQLLYALSLSQPYSNLSQYATRISDAKLEWNDQVHHAYWLAHGRMATSADLANATAIFRQNNQDANKSLVEILVGITGSY